MNKDHAKQILVALAEWYAESNEGPQSGALLFGDDHTLRDHITMALGGIAVSDPEDIDTSGRQMDRYGSL